MTIFDPDRLIAQTILQLMQEDVKHLEGGGHYPTIITQVNGAYYMPLDWVEKYAEGFKDPWEKFMNGNTFCENGFYLRDVTRFLSSKVRK